MAPSVEDFTVGRAQSAPMDVVYQFFATPCRSFVAGDCPGHEQYLTSTVAAASTTDVMVLVIDARRGLLAHTRTHAYLASILGVRRVVLAVNKMDLAGFDETVFERICSTWSVFVEQLGFDEVVTIPLSARCGDNVHGRSTRMPWYEGPTLQGYLESTHIERHALGNFVLPVQLANYTTSAFCSVSGTVARGCIRPGDEVRVMLSGKCAHVSEIITFDGIREQARAGDAITLALDRQIEVSRGDVLTMSSSPVETTDHFNATIIWMHDEAGLAGRNYDLKLGGQSTSACITTIKHRVDANTLAREPSRELALNDVAICNIATSRPLAFIPYDQSATLGGFILIDYFSRKTVAAGLFHYGLRRGKNLRHQPFCVTRESRERLNGHRGRVIWFTGLSGSGKSTIANALEKKLHSQGKRTYILDGDNIRQGINKDLGFTEPDRVENIRRVAEVARLMMDAGLVVISAFISPFRKERSLAQQLVGTENFLEVYIKTPLAVCEQRDPKGLYRKARSGQIPNMTGVNSPYEEPQRPDFVIETTELSVDECVNILVGALNY